MQARPNHWNNHTATRFHLSFLFISFPVHCINVQTLTWFVTYPIYTHITSLTRISYITYWYQTLKALSKGQRSHFYILWDTPITKQIAYNRYIVQSSFFTVFTFFYASKEMFLFCNLFLSFEISRKSPIVMRIWKFSNQTLQHNKNNKILYQTFINWPSYKLVCYKHVQWFLLTEHWIKLNSCSSKQVLIHRVTVLLSHWICLKVLIMIL